MMAETDKKRVRLKFMTLWILLVYLAGVVHTTGLIASSEQNIKASAQTQDGAPLLISQVAVDSASGSRQPKIDYTITNVSGKPVNAYAVRHIVSHGNNQTQGVLVRNSTASESLLRVGQTESASLENDMYSEAVQHVELILDFVEFADGTVWGIDKFESAERLRGQRAGAQALAERLMMVSEDKGADAVPQHLSAEDSDVTPPADHTAAWIGGFSEGVSFKRGRLRRAHSKYGAKGVEDELRRSFDTVDKLHPASKGGNE